MYRSDRHRQFVHRRRNITSYRGAQTVLRRPVNHRGEHTLPVERIARRPQVDLAVAANITPDHDGAAEGEAFGVRVDDLKAAVAPSLLHLWQRRLRRASDFRQIPIGGRSLASLRVTFEVGPSRAHGHKPSPCAYQGADGQRLRARPRARPPIGI